MGKVYSRYTRYTKKSPQTLENTGSMQGSTPVWSTRKPLILLGFLNEKFKRYTSRYTTYGKGGLLNGVNSKIPHGKKPGKGDTICEMQVNRKCSGSFFMPKLRYRKGNIMFSDEILEKIFANERINEIPIVYRSIMIEIIEKVLTEENAYKF